MIALAPAMAPVRLPLWRGASRVLTIVGVAVAVAGFTAVLTGGTWALPLSLVAAIALGLAGGTTTFESLRSGKGFAGIGSSVLAVVLYLAVYVSADQLVRGHRISVLDYLGLPLASVREDTLRAVALFVLAAGAFAVGEGWVAARPVPEGAGPRRRVASYRPVFLALLVVGTVTTLLTGHRVDAAALAVRGQVTGQGVLAVLQQMLPLALALGILHRHWHSKALTGLSGAGLVVYLAVVQSRSMLLFVGLAAVLRTIESFRTRAVRPRDATVLLGLTYAATLFIVAFGEWRSAVRAYGSSEFLPWVGRALPTPWQELSAKGSLDTLDGLVLSLHVQRSAVGASVLDPLKGVVNLVPAQIWPGKPEYLGPRVTHQYTDFGGRSGIFLSGPGYLYVVYYGLLGMAVGALVLGLGIACLLRRTRRSMILTAVVVYGLSRFLIGGDAFDLQYSLALLMSLGFGVLVARATGWWRLRPGTGEATGCA